MEYTNEAFIKMTLALMPGTIFNDCIFEECNLIIFDDNIVTNNCKLINNKITIVERVL